MAARDQNGDGAADAMRTLAQGLQCPYGLVVLEGFLYVAQSTTVERFPVGDGGAHGAAQVVVSGLPESACAPHHYRPLAIDGAGNLYVAFGSSCNVCVEPDPRRGTVWQYAPDGTGREFARGLRNVVDLEFHPLHGTLWAATNERDALGDDVPPEPVMPVQAGANYGWPYCYWSGSGWSVDRRVPANNPACAGLTTYFGIQAHSAPLGLAFAGAASTGAAGQFPPEYQGDAFVGLHGSWNRSTGTGFKVIRIPVDSSGMPQLAEDFVAGWLTGPRGPQDAWGRPVDVELGGDGALFVSDDVAGAVYRVSLAG
jgi:glucose/arabinose dehydrogenase